MNDQLVVVGLDERAVEAIDGNTGLATDMNVWVALARSVLQTEGISDHVELNLTFVDRDEMAVLNLEHMGHSGPTDVLSFPLYEQPLDPHWPADHPPASPHGHEQDGIEPRLLGDIVVCPEVVAEQAKGSVEDEMALMVVHGVLHILGMDHADADEATEMKAAESRHLEHWRTDR